MKRWIVPLTFLVVLSSLICWRVGQKRADAAAQNEQRASRKSPSAPVAVAPVEIRDIFKMFEVTGSVEAPVNVKISPKVTGRIDFLNVREGDHVKRGQVLVKIDPSQVEAEVEQARSAVAEAQYRLAQAQLSQGPSDAAVNTQVRQQKAGVSSAQADYNQVRENYKAQLAAADASVADAAGRVESANAAVSNAKAAIGSAQANLENAKSKYNRIQGLYKQGYISAQDVDDAKTALAAQEAAVEVSKGQLKAATAQLSSAAAQKQSAEQQANIVRTKGKADIEASQAKFSQAQASLDYAKANTASKSAYQQSLAALKSSVAAAQASLRSAQARRADTVLISPLDGFVTGRYIDVGGMAAPGQPIIAVQFMKQVWVTISVPEEINSRVHIGQQARVAVDAMPGKTFIGSIIQVNPSADPASRQFMARVILDNAQNLFRPGMFARVSIETERAPKAVAVPREAIQSDREGDFVIVVDKDKVAHKTPIVKGLDGGDFVAVLEGVKPGDKVVTMSAFPIKDGQKVKTGDKKGKGQKKLSAISFQLSAGDCASSCFGTTVRKHSDSQLTTRNS